jgi:hypothetical protein
MSLVATVHRHVFSGAYERMARLSGALCRIGVLLAVLQLLSWCAVTWLHADASAAAREARHEAKMTALETMVAPSIAALARTDRKARSGLPQSFEWSMNGVREISRSLLWGVAIILIPMIIAVGVLSPFIRDVESSRVLFGMIAVLGLLPLSSAEAAPALIGSAGFPAMPTSMLAGLAAPAVAVVLLAAAAVLLAPGRRMVLDDQRGAGAPRISPHELETIIRRGQHPRTRRLRSSRPQRTGP